MRRITFLLFTVATLAGVVGYTATASRFRAQEAASIFLTEIPAVQAFADSKSSAKMRK